MLRILIVEDNPADAQILKMALERTGAPLDVVAVEDGVEAMEYLSARNPGRCDLVLLDLNLPRLSGFEVLDRIRSRDDLKSLPVVVLSGSADTSDVDRSYRAGANSYICKPTHLVDILCTAAQIVTYWSQCVKLPSGSVDPGPPASYVARVRTAPCGYLSPATSAVAERSGSAIAPTAQTTK